MTHSQARFSNMVHALKFTSSFRHRLSFWLNSVTIISAETPSHLTLTLLSSQNGATIEKKAECKTCTCQDAGEMVCEDFECPALNCDDNEIEGKLHFCVGKIYGHESF